MPRPPVRPIYVSQVAGWLAEGFKPGEIWRRLDEWAEEEGRADCPRERTVYRIAERLAKWPEHERRASGLLRWPESFEAGLLPWEAARPALDLWRTWHAAGKGCPTVRVARWYWRLLMADPTLARQTAADMAELRAVSDSAALSGLAPVVGPRWLELRLAYQPDRSDDDRAAHEAAETASAQLICTMADGTTLNTVEFRQGLWGEEARARVERSIGATETRALSEYTQTVLERDYRRARDAPPATASLKDTQEGPRRVRLLDRGRGTVPEKDLEALMKAQEEGEDNGEARE